MNNFFVFLLFFVSISFLNPSLAQSNTLEEGRWKIKLIPNDSISIPFYFDVKIEENQKLIFAIVNGDENIEINSYKIIDDSLYIYLPVFNSEFHIQILDGYNICGKWMNYAKGENYAIPLVGYKTKEDRFSFKETKKNINFTGNYEVVFSPQEDPWKAVGLFHQKKNRITGTFLTETGDYRFLEGNAYGNEIFLSCFDGSHAFVFTGKMIGDTIYGDFYSGNHYHTDWIASKNTQFKLRDPDSITVQTHKSDIAFELPDLDSNLYQFPNSKLNGKILIVQIMGSWCPNCMDETKFYKELYAKYKDQGLEIIAIAFETPKDFTSKARMLKKLKNHFDIQYKILVGGDASKKIASDIFPSLNSIVSFPTSIFIDKNNKIRRIHTGFNGPGTNKHYKEYVDKTMRLIEEMLKE
ncbi:MAG: TlpA disulfide reductase family protein [Crocinitomicaceae bacterium]